MVVSSHTRLVKVTSRSPISFIRPLLVSQHDPLFLLSWGKAAFTVATQKEHTWTLLFVICSIPGGSGLHRWSKGTYSLSMAIGSAGFATKTWQSSLRRTNISVRLCTATVCITRWITAPVVNWKKDPGQGRCATPPDSLVTKAARSCLPVFETWRYKKNAIKSTAGFEPAVLFISQASPGGWE